MGTEWVTPGLSRMLPSKHIKSATIGPVSTTFKIAARSRYWPENIYWLGQSDTLIVHVLFKNANVNTRASNGAKKWL